VAERGLVSALRFQQTELFGARIALVLKERGANRAQKREQQQNTENGVNTSQRRSMGSDPTLGVIHIARKEMCG